MKPSTPSSKDGGLNLPSPLRPYQWEGVRFLLDQCSVLLADGMGLGKTVQVAVALTLLFRSGGRSRAIVVVPASLRLNWLSEIRRWAPELSVRIVRGDGEERRAHYRLPFNVLVASYEQVRADALAIANDVRFHVVVLDEAQRIKNENSRTALACRLLRRDCSWALTGTPIENRVADLISVYRFVRPGLINPGMPRPTLHAAMQPYFLRRRKEDVLPELPPIVVQDVPLELEGSQKETYERAWAGRTSAVRGSATDFSLTHVLARVTRLKQICNFDPHSDESSKMDALDLIVEGLTGPNDKLIVFSQFVEALHKISRRIRDRIASDIFHGRLRDDVKTAIVARFNDEAGPRMLLMSLRAGGVGLNLQGASAVVLFDRWWNPAVEEQAIHRAHRFGRDQRLHVYRFLVADSIEERIANVLEEKRIIFEQYVESAESAPTLALTKGDLARILDLT